jgi:putative transferase (TIGR04331 family)
MVGVDMGWDPEGDALMVEVTMPRYSYHMYSVPVAGQWLGYFDEQCRFVDALPDDIRRSLLVRLYGIDYGWNQSARWRERFPDIRLDEGRAPIAPLISKSRLYVSTYNATTFLESMAMNIPTIIFWNVHQWEIRDSAVPFFERLKSAGIFHETPELAAHQMTKVWHNVANWWNSNPVQGARREFCSRYSHIPQNPLENLEGVLRRIAPAAME